MRQFDVIVVGGGHAGCEAAAAAARLGASVALVTLRNADIGTLSCNPAIGGLGKGHLVREIDSLDGLIGRIADRAATQYRLLNRSKGPAVQGPRVQVDRQHYQAAMWDAMAAQEQLTIVEASAEALTLKQGAVVGIDTSIGPIRAQSVVITTGTFLSATMHQGDVSRPGGRHGATATHGLARSLDQLGLPIARFKTGTPPRLDGRTIDWAKVGLQYGDDAPVSMSDESMTHNRPFLPCGVTRTNQATHALIRKNIGFAPVYAGRIEGTGPRYCPSIEDKVMRFGDREGHQIYLEPEGYDDPTIYPNGISTSLPAEIQEEMVRTIVGLERVRLVRPGYAVEYSVIDPRALTPALAVRGISGLYFAGQINGTTGYEEAAGQGLVAGINAAREVAGNKPVIFDRSSSYIGVMIDDLVVNGTSEPYRMFTSRAEYRLSLRIDNAAARLTPIGIGIGIVGATRRARYLHRAAALNAARLLLTQLEATPNRLSAAGIAVNQDGRVRTADVWLAHPEVDWVAACRIWPVLKTVGTSIAETLSTDMRYSIYLERQAREVLDFKRDETLQFPDHLDYSQIAGLSDEMIERLSRACPATLGAAKRVPGVTAGAITALLSYTRRAA